MPDVGGTHVPSPLRSAHVLMNYGTIGTFHLFYEKEAITNVGTRFLNIF